MMNNEIYLQKFYKKALILVDVLYFTFYHLQLCNYYLLFLASQIK
jgi:hypothetical protein